ncbi:hypothetical protein WJX81_003932 [Elliptochloris bilobata]|uniref:Uncharacterized protein n=1 Tax=Elliptochloris bilobata TaxID=381761 RepID=A0AAW1S4P0_9CHLO
MFYDLNLSGDESDAFLQRERLAMAVRLGYDCLATNHQAADRLAESDRCTHTPFDATSLVAAGGSGVREALRSQQGLIRTHAPPRQVQQLSRLTLAVDEAAVAAAALAPGAPLPAGYDIVAVQPMSERVLQQACTALDVDVITFDLARRLPYRLRPAALAAAVKRGVALELCYAPALRDEASRRTLFSNAAALVRATRGHGIILSSGARAAFELRGPYDAVNLATLLGLRADQAQVAVSSRCADV